MDWLAPLPIGVNMGLILALAVLGLAISWRLFSFPDITVEGAFLLGAGVYAASVRAGAPGFVAVLVACAAGAVAGIVTATLHSKLRINRFLAGILVTAVAYSLTLRIMSAPNIGLLSFGLESPLTSSYALWILVGGVSLLAIFALATQCGLQVRVAGSNPIFAAALGIDVPKRLMLGLAGTNALSAASGVMMVSHQRFADIGMGQGILIIAVAGMAVGERLLPTTRLPRHAYVVVAAVFGSLVYYTAVAYALSFGVPSTDLKLATALLVLLILALSRWTAEGLRDEGDYGA